MGILLSTVMARAGYRENRADASLVSSRGAPGDARRRYIARRGRLGRDRSRDEGQKILVRGQQLLARRERPPRLASPREGAVLGTGVRASSKSEAASSQGRVPGGPSSSVRPSGSEAGASPGGGAGTSSVVVDYAAAKVGGGRCGKGASEEEEEEGRGDDAVEGGWILARRGARVEWASRRSERRSSAWSRCHEERRRLTASVSSPAASASAAMALSLEKPISTSLESAAESPEAFWA
mmetsp:Transcript_7987/g.24577  ORF Transcript_7987/g.24577 Transcript_7987/m.24577 type:complete len:238 (+) Transcript_7987:137-850(+)